MKELIKISFIRALLTVAYVSAVAILMTYAERIFGQTKTIIAPIAFLLLFVTSAAVTGYLVLGNPVMFYLDGRKKEAVQLFGYTVGWLAVFTLLFILISYLVK